MQRPSERAIFQLFDQVQSHGTQQFTFPRIGWCLLVKVRINCNHEKLLQMRFYMHPQWTCCSLLLRRYRRCHSPCTFDRLSFTPRSSSALTAGKVAGTYSPLAAPFSPWTSPTMHQVMHMLRYLFTSFLPLYLPLLPVNLIATNATEERHHHHHHHHSVVVARLIGRHNAM